MGVNSALGFFELSQAALILHEYYFSSLSCPVYHHQLAVCIHALVDIHSSFLLVRYCMCLAHCDHKKFCACGTTCHRTKIMHWDYCEAQLYCVFQMLSLLVKA